MKNAFYHLLLFLSLLASINTLCSFAVSVSFVSALEVSSPSQTNRASDFKLNSEHALGAPSDEDTPLDPEDTDIKIRRRLSLSELNGPFLMNQVAKEKAATSQENIEDDLESLSSVKVADVPRSRAQIRHQPKATTTIVQNTTVSPMCKRLLTDESKKTTNETEFLSTNSEGNRQEFAKLWWVNLWIQQMPSNKQDDLANCEQISNFGEDTEEEQTEAVPFENGTRFEDNAIENEVLVEQISTEQNYAQQHAVELQNIDTAVLKKEREIMSDSAPRNGVGMEDSSALEGTAFMSSGMVCKVVDAIALCG